jgi:hypothetical protein
VGRSIDPSALDYNPTSGVRFSLQVPSHADKRTTVNNRVIVHINGAKVGAAARATVSDSQGNRRGILVDAEIVLVEPGSDLETLLESEKPRPERTISTSL